MAGLLGVHVDNWGHPEMSLLVYRLRRLLVLVLLVLLVLLVHTQKARQLRPCPDTLYRVALEKTAVVLSFGSLSRMSCSLVGVS